MKKNIAQTYHQGENAIIVEEVDTMPEIAQKKEGDLTLEENTIVGEDIEADLEVIIIEEDIQGQKVLEVIEKEAIEDIEDIEVKAEAGVEEVEIVVIMKEEEIVKVVEIIEINLVEVIIVLIEAIILEVKEVIIVNNRIPKIIKKMKKMIKMEMKI